MCYVNNLAMQSSFRQSLSVLLTEFKNAVKAQIPCRRTPLPFTT
jgi:hypothetical protein